MSHLCQTCYHDHGHPLDPLELARCPECAEYASAMLIDEQIQADREQAEPSPRERVAEAIGDWGER